MDRARLRPEPSLSGRSAPSRAAAVEGDQLQDPARTNTCGRSFSTAIRATSKPTGTVPPTPFASGTTPRGFMRRRRGANSCTGCSARALLDSAIAAKKHPTAVINSSSSAGIRARGGPGGSSVVDGAFQGARSSAIFVRFLASLPAHRIGEARQWPVDRTSPRVQ